MESSQDKQDTSDKKSLNSLKKKFKNESFGKINIDKAIISYENLTFNKCYSLSQHYLDQSEKFNKYNSRNLRFFYLNKAYQNDNTNLNLIEKIQEFQKELCREKDITTLETIEKILDLYKPLLNKTTKYQINKIFDLIELLSNYNQSNIYDKYQVEKYLSDFNKENQIAREFNNEISPEKGQIYIYTIYYSWVVRLIEILEKLEKEEMKDNKENLKHDYDNLKDFLDYQKRNIFTNIKKIMNIENNNITEEDLNIAFDK